MAQADRDPTTSRRSLLAGLGAAAITVPAIASATPSPAIPAEWEAAKARLTASEKSEAVFF